MCVAAIPLAIGAAVIGGAGKLIGGINASNQASYTASVDQANAALDRKAAQDALERGAEQEQQQYQRTSQLLGQQRAAMAANGIEVDSGSALDVQEGTREIGSQDASILRQNATREANGYEINAFNDTTKATAARAAGKGALIGSFFDAGSTILSGASQTQRLKAGSVGG